MASKLRSIAVQKPKNVTHYHNEYRDITFPWLTPRCSWIGFKIDFIDDLTKWRSCKVQTLQFFDGPVVYVAPLERLENSSNFNGMKVFHSL